MELNSFVSIFLLTFASGFLVYQVFRLYLSYKLRKKQDAFMLSVKDKMDALGKQIEQRALNLQESVDMVSKEYNDMLKKQVKPSKNEVKLRGRLKDKLASSTPPRSPKEPPK